MSDLSDDPLAAAQKAINDSAKTRNPFKAIQHLLFAVIDLQAVIIKSLAVLRRDLIAIKKDLGIPT